MMSAGRFLPRRTLLRGLGAAVALPLLDGMAPATAAGRTAADRPVERLVVTYVPNGIVMSDWTPAGNDETLALSPILQPLAPFRDAVTVVSGLRNGPPSYAVHAVASTEFLTGMPPAPSTGSIAMAGISMDQLVARESGRYTQLASLEMSLESGYAGACDIGTSCVYNDTIAWRGPATPLPMEHDPRAVFERLFGDSDSTDPDTTALRLGERRSILDSVGDAIGDLSRGLGGRDRARVGEYLDAIRDIERRIQRAEQQDAVELPSIARPAGVPDSFPEYATLMFDLQVLALQSDLTRVITCMMGRELSGRTFPQIDVREAHHPVSHHRNDPEKLAMLTKINTHHVGLFASFLERMRSTPDGDGSLLDHVAVLYGAGMSDGNTHAQADLPVLLVGHGAGLSGGRHLRVNADTPLANLHATLLPRLGVDVESFANSTGRLSDL